MQQMYLAQRHGTLPISQAFCAQPCAQSIPVPQQLPVPDNSQEQHRMALQQDDSHEVTVEFSQEVLHIFDIYNKKPEALITMFSSQLTFLKTESQAILALCGLAITVTGFSGSNVIRAGSLSSGFLVAGICLILIAGSIALYSLSSVKWVTEMLDADQRVVISRVIKRRNTFKAYLVVAAGFLGLGLVCYLAAVAIAAVIPADQMK